tara:strand:+ start:7720 stop:7899 length:180 start_codon:yes stop_codon:yes gene_type:complete
MPNYHIKMIQEYEEDYFVEANSEKRAIEMLYEDDREPESTTAGDSRVKLIELCTYPKNK